MTRRDTCLFAVFAVLSARQLPAQHNRITSPADSRQRFTLAGHVNPKALIASEQGRLDPSMLVPYVTLVLKPSAAQQADLERVLTEQQDPASPMYHQWLSPEQYADRFGATQDDVDQIVAWLEDQQLAVVQVARARNAITFQGSAAQIERALGTEFHHYLWNGARHFATATEPSLPAAFRGVVAGIHGLNDFRLRSPKRASPAVSARPDYTSGGNSHYLAPDDVAVIYNIKPLYGMGVDGSGQKLVVAGQSAVRLTDIQKFRSYFNLPANDPQVRLVPNTRDPGLVSGDDEEATLDIELSGAVARKASILYVYASDVMDAVQYAIDQNLAPVLSVSYGLCELETSTADAVTMQSWARQANAQGITWFAASGDSGGADCMGGNTRANARLSVDLPAGIPEVTGIGGTEFAEGSGTYWNTSGDQNHASAVSYIPEVAWNDSSIDSQPSATGGGASIIFSKPSWQSGMGVPDDGARDVPDVSLAGSADHDGYLIYSGGALKAVGGTSVGAPSFAGIAALLNAYLMANGIQSSAGLGNMNPRLYQISQSRPEAFHDITAGDNAVAVCPRTSRFCSASPIGYSAGAGYDPVTGLGSVDTYNLVTAWYQPPPADQQ